jgi:DNA phosphorothioation-associated putative methyltransferase
MSVQVKSLRHRTAISRASLSRPLRLALDAELINRDITVLDYGCGRGDDLQALCARGIRCFGWDPVFRPNGKRQEADVVNIGYVVNVIEDPAERLQTLHEAWKLTRKILLVSARLSVEAEGSHHRSYNDGYLTQRGTFQKFYTQGELRDWLDTTLGVNSIAAAPGIFFVFRDEALKQTYTASQYRRRLSVPTQRQSDVLFERHREFLQPLMDFVTSRGRLPDESELPDVTTLRQVFGSIQRAFGVVQWVTGKTQWNTIREQRTQDLLVYLALQRFRGRPRFSGLLRDLQLDVKAFFGTYTRACAAADDLLFSAGKLETIDAACRQAPYGKLTPEALYVHITGLQTLSPILRVYEGCAQGYIGAVEGANVVKLDRRKPKISYLSYPNFDNDPHPTLTESLVVQLQDFKVRYYDYRDSESPPILHRKEAFVPTSHPSRGKFERLTRQEERWGLFENSSTIGTREKWKKLLAQKGLCLRGHRLMRVHE